jgi:hypothetical protein
MNSFGQGPREGMGAEQNGPILVVPPPPHKPSKWDLWKGRFVLVVFVLFCLEVGILLTVLPWTRLWTDNTLVASYPQLQEFLRYDFLRGLISGLGLVDIWLGIAEAVRYRESMD